MMFSNYPSINSLSTDGWRLDDLNAIKDIFRCQLDCMFDFCGVIFAGDFFTRFPVMREYIRIDNNCDTLDKSVREKVVAAILASYLHRVSLDVNSREFVLSFKLYEQVLNDMGDDDVGTYFALLDNYYRVNRNNAYGKHGWQIVKMILWGSADNTSRHGLLDETPDANFITGNTIIAAGLLAQLTNGEDRVMAVDLKRNLIIEFATMFDGFFKMNPPKYAQ